MSILNKLLGIDEVPQGEAMAQQEIYNNLRSQARGGQPDFSHLSPRLLEMMRPYVHPPQTGSETIDSVIMELLDRINSRGR